VNAFIGKHSCCAHQTIDHLLPILCSWRVGDAKQCDGAVVPDDGVADTVVGGLRKTAISHVRCLKIKFKNQF